VTCRIHNSNLPASDASVRLATSFGRIRENIYRLRTERSCRRSKSKFLTPWSRVLLKKLRVSQLVKKSPAFYATQRSLLHSQACHVSLSAAQRISPSPRHCYILRNSVRFYGEELVAPHPTPKLEDHPMSAVRDFLFNIFAATHHIWKPFLHPQPQEAPCCGDTDPFITVWISHWGNKCLLQWFYWYNYYCLPCLWVKLQSYKIVWLFDHYYNDKKRYGELKTECITCQVRRNRKSFNSVWHSW
jgi:hypothetical protein